MNDEIKFTLNELSFTWDDRKAAANFRKHKVSFELAAEVLFDDYAIDMTDEQHNQDEDRRQIIGATNGKLRVLFVVYVERVRHDNVELIRIISARDANRKEAELYGLVLPQGRLSEKPRRSNKSRNVRKRRRH